MSTKRAVFSDEAPKPGGRYSPAVVVGNMVFVSGQMGIDPATGEMEKTGFRAEAERTFQNLRINLKAAGASMSDVVKVQVLLTDLDNFSVLNELFIEAFEDAEVKPTRTTFQAGLLLGGSIEIDAVAVLKD